MKRIAMINHKGGVGKTTTLSTLATLIGKLGKKVLIVDVDPQGNSSKMFGRYMNTEKTASDMFKLRGEALNVNTVAECIYNTDYENVDIIPNNDDFSFTIDSVFCDTSRQNQLILKKALRLVDENYDYVLIDTNPFYNLISVNALAYVDGVLTPLEADGFSFQGLMNLLGKIEMNKEEFNPNLKFLGVFLTKIDESTNVAKDMIENYKDDLEQIYISSYIRSSVKAYESSTKFEPLPYHDPNGIVTLDYKILLKNLHILDEVSQKKLEKELNDHVKKLKQRNKADVEKIRTLQKEEKNKVKIGRLKTTIKAREKDIIKITE